MKQLFKIILASGSPRRRELLKQAGLEFRVVTADTDETINENEPAKVVEELSLRKAKSVRMALESEGMPAGDNNGPEGAGRKRVILAADTVVSAEGVILGKPETRERAIEMLRFLSGRTHEVYTGVTLIYETFEEGNIEDRTVTFSECTKVTFYRLSEEEIEDYAATGEPMDKAGAYGIQGLGVELVEKIEGDYNNVVGLPLARVLREMKRL